MGWDRERARRAEDRARELMRSVVAEDEYEMYRDLGFIRVVADDGAYGYLIYPHRPIVSYDAERGGLLSEYCVGFHDPASPTDRLPEADDVLAKWLALRADERTLISDANIDVPGRQVDPDHVRRDLRRLEAWQNRRLARRPGREAEQAAID
jgi:hypothetical protein